MAQSLPEPARGQDRYPFDVFPRGWFRACYADELEAGQVQRLHRFGRELVLFRGEDGEAHLFDAYCPHMGAHLGVGGAVVGNGIRCPFHHWEFDGSGRCSRIPYARRIPPKARLHAWPLVERNGILMFYHDRAGGEPDFEVPALPELGDPDWLPLDRHHWTVRASWLDMNENCVDQAHFKYVHGTLSIPPTTARIEGHVHVAESLFRMRAPEGEVDAKLVTLDYGPGLQVVRITGLIDSLMVNTSTPIDEERTDVSFAYTVRAAGDPRKQKLAGAVVRDLLDQFEADRPIWENKAYRSRPLLCDGDGPLPVYRKWMQQFV